MDSFWGMPKVAWAVVFDVVACVFYALGMRLVRGLRLGQSQCLLVGYELGQEEATGG